MTFAESDWEQESAYARFVLEPPSAEDLRHKADLDRKRLKEEGSTRSECSCPEGGWSVGCAIASHRWYAGAAS